MSNPNSNPNPNPNHIRNAAANRLTVDWLVHGLACPPPPHRPSNLTASIYNIIHIPTPVS